MREICPKLTIKTPKRHQWQCSGPDFIHFSSVSIVYREQVSDDCAVGESLFPNAVEKY